MSEQEKREDDLTPDVVEFTEPVKSNMSLDTDVLRADLDMDFGAKILQDGSWLGMSVSRRTDERPYVSAFLGLSPEQAREIAAALEQAADDAEAAAESAEPEERPETVLGRIREVLAQ